MYRIAAAALALSAAANARPAPQSQTVPESDIVHSSPATTATAASASNIVHSQVVDGTSTFPTLAPSSITAQSAAATATTSVHNGGLHHEDVFRYPLANGFPSISNPSPQLDAIDKAAGGELPNGGAPTGLHADTINAVAFVAFNELFEVAFFTELLHNVTTSAEGFADSDLLGNSRQDLIDILTTVVAQEELHELNVNGIVNANIHKTVKPCTYHFDISSFTEAITTASTFTDVVLGTLPDVQTVAGSSGDFGIIGAVGSSLGEEGEQNGFYRDILHKTPPQLPFLTRSARNFAYNAILQQFVVECPASTLDLLEKPAAGTPLNETGILTPPVGLSLKDTVAKFSLQTVNPKDTKSYYEQHKQSGSWGNITYLNQLNKPLTVPITSFSLGVDEIIIEASFPGKTQFLNGLTIAAVTAPQAESFTSADDVAAATLFGPGIIEIN